MERVSVLAYKVGNCLLRSRLKERHMTQQELANRLGITVQQINKYVMNRQKMTLETAYNIANALDCYVEELYTWNEVGTK